MLRSIISIIAGFILWYVLIVILWVLFGYSVQNKPPEGFLIFSLLIEIIFAVGAGYVTALIANKGKEQLHGFILGIVFAVLGMVDVIVCLVKEIQDPLWIPISTIVIIAPCAVLGGWLRSKRVDHIWNESL